MSGVVATLFVLGATGVAGFLIGYGMGKKDGEKANEKHTRDTDEGDTP